MPRLEQAGDSGQGATVTATGWTTPGSSAARLMGCAWLAKRCRRRVDEGGGLRRTEEEGSAGVDGSGWTPSGRTVDLTIREGNVVRALREWCSSRKLD